MDLGLYGRGWRRWRGIESICLSIADCGGFSGRWGEVEVGR